MGNMRVKYMSLDIGKENNNAERVTVQQGENVSLELDVDISAYGEPLDLTGKLARFKCLRPDGSEVTMPAEITDAENGLVRFVFREEICAVVGNIALAYFELYDDAGWTATTESFEIAVTKGVSADSVTPECGFTSCSAARRGADA